MNIGDIKNCAASTEVFFKGYKYYDEGRITIQEHTCGVDENFSILEKYDAVAKGNHENKYTLTLEIGQEHEIKDYFCTCKAYATYTGACKHIVALMLEVNAKLQKELYKQLDKESKERKYPIVQDDADARLSANPGKSELYVRRLIGAYSNKNLMDIKSESTDTQKSTLEFKLTISGRDVGLSAMVGKKRMYVVKNIKEFCENMINGEEVRYGKDLTLLHLLSSFTEESKPLAEYLLDRYEEIKSYENKNQWDSDFGYDNTKRRMNLGRGNIDKLMEIMMNQDIKIEGNQTLDIISHYARQYYNHSNNKIIDNWKYKQECVYTVMEKEALKLDITIKKDDKSEFYVHCQEIDYIKGKDHIYMAERNKGKYRLYRAGHEFSDNMSDFMEAVNMGEGQLRISSKDMAEFCANVVPAISEFVNITEGKELLEDFMPSKGKLKVYLDAPGTDTITAMLLCEYNGGVQFDLVSNKIVVTDDIAPVTYEEAKEKSKNIVRDVILENKGKLNIVKHFDGYDHKVGVLYFVGTDEKIYDFIKNTSRDLIKLATVFTTERYRRMGTVAPPKTNVGVKLDSELLKIEFDLDQFDIPDLMGALSRYKQKKKYYRMRNGSFIDLNDDDFNELLSFVDEFGLTKSQLEKGYAELPKYKAMLLNGVLKNSNSIKFERDGHFKSLIRSMKSIDESDHKVPEILEGVLRDYQKDGFQWLKTMSQYGFCGILADEMGLGKTVQIIALLEDARTEFTSVRNRGTTGECKKMALVICPSSLVLNWEKEINKFTPDLKVATVIGTAKQRSGIIKDSQDDCVLVTSYDLFRRDLEYYQSVGFEYCIIDEAQYIKNQSTQNARAVKLVNSVHRFALTGTPIENRLSELWSIFDFLMPEYLYAYSKFKETFETAIVKDRDEDKMELLKRQVSPFLLRRLKKNVLKELPEKIETVVYAKLEGEQNKLYKANLAKAKLEIGEKIKEKGFEGSRMAILALLVRLRQICCHPGLCYEGYQNGSSKLETCMELIDEAVSGGHKVLLFSQFTSMLDVIEAELNKKSIEIFKLTGSTAKEKRSEMVDEFNEEGSEISVFLISLKAGGTGLNLTAADVVIHYDPWWNIAAQNQATDRAHRIGQKKNLQVYKIIAQDTIEEKILELQENKKNLADAIITENEAIINSISGEEMLKLLS